MIDRNSSTDTSLHVARSAIRKGTSNWLFDIPGMTFSIPFKGKLINPTKSRNDVHRLWIRPRIVLHYGFEQGIPTSMAGTLLEFDQGYLGFSTTVVGSQVKWIEFIRKDLWTVPNNWIGHYTTGSRLTELPVGTTPCHRRKARLIVVGWPHSLGDRPWWSSEQP